MNFLVVSEGWEYFNIFTNKWEFGNPLNYLCVCVCVGGRHISYTYRDWKFKDLNRKMSDCIIMCTHPCDLEYCLERIRDKALLRSTDLGGSFRPL